MVATFIACSGCDAEDRLRLPNLTYEAAKAIVEELGWKQGPSGHIGETEIAKWYCPSCEVPG